MPSLAARNDANSTTTRPRVVVVGSLNCDVVFRVPHHPQPGETLTAASVARVSGGKGANQAVAAARLGADVTLIGTVGDDDDGRFLRGEVLAAGVGDGIATRGDAATGAAYINVSDAGENTIVLAPGANATLGPNDLSSYADTLQRADVLLIQLETTLDAITAAIDAVGERTCVILDPAPAVALPDELLRRVDVISPNQTEAAVYVDGRTAAEQAAKLVAHYGGTAVMKLGADGALARTAGAAAVVEQAAFPVDVVDTTAAGDAFTAALGVALAERRSLPEALAFACAAGSLATTAAGAQPSLPSREQVEALLAAG